MDVGTVFLMVFSRRRFIGGAASAMGLAAVGGLAACTPRSEPDRENTATGNRADELLGEMRIEVTLEGDDHFTEGPAVAPDGDVYFTDMRASRIHRWNPATKQLSILREDENRANGLLFDSVGRLLACEAGSGRITRTDLKSGQIEVLADSYEDRPIQAPNDLALDSKGRIYFSSRSREVAADANVKAVYRIDPDGTVAQLLAEPDVHMPNGLAITADDATLYLIEADGAANRYRHIKAFDLLDDGTVANPRVLVDFYPGRSGDGMCLGPNGNLYVAAGLHELRDTSETLDTLPGIHVFSPSGELLAYRETPEDLVTNCAISEHGDPRLYVTCGGLLLSARV